MKRGISTYAYHWRRPSLTDMLADVQSLGGEVLQVCDWPEFDALGTPARRDLGREADRRGVELELGTRAGTVEEVGRFLTYCADVGSRLLRVLPGPGLVNADVVGEILAAGAADDITLAFETYESVDLAALLSVVGEVDAPRFGICLDPSNCVAALERPSDVIAAAGPLTVNLHVKDFTFRRRPDRIGFELIGAPLGDGMLDLDALIGAVPASVNAIIELWLPASGPDTAALEAAWTETSFSRLTQQLTTPRTPA